MKPSRYLHPHHSNPRWKNRILSKHKHTQVSTLNGKTPNLKSSKGFAYNFLWILLIFLSTLICSYQTYDRFSFFLSRPIDMKISLIRNYSVKFPSITLCPARNNFIPLVNMRMEKAKEKQQNHFCEVHPTALLDHLDVSTLWDLMSINGTLKEVIEVLSSKTSETEMEANTSNDLPSLSIKIDTKTVFGTCNTYSLKNLVRFQKDDYALTFTFRKDLQLCSKNSIGMFMLHNEEDIVTYKAASESKQQQLNRKVTYGLSALRFKILNQTKNPCDTNQAVNECEKNCFEKSLKTMSRCRFPLTSLPKMPLCTSGNDSFDAYNKLFDLAISTDYLTKCNCPKICDEVLYTDHLKMTEQSNESSLSIYFDDNVIEEIEEYYSYTFVSFICDFGGNLGLFLGLSIPAVFQLGGSVVEYAIKNAR